MAGAKSCRPQDRSLVPQTQEWPAIRLGVLVVYRRRRLGATVDSGSYIPRVAEANGKWLTVRDTYNPDRPLPPQLPAAPEKK